MNNSGWLAIRATLILSMIALTVSLGSRRITAWEDGQLWVIAGVILLGGLVGWFLFPFVKRYLLLQSLKFSSMAVLAVLLGFIIWCFRPVPVTVPWENLEVEVLGIKNPQSQGYEVNLIGAKGWGGEPLALEAFSKAKGWTNSKDVLTGVYGGEALTIPGHLKDRGEVVIEFKASARSGIVKLTTGYQGKIVDLYASSDTTVAVSIGRDYLNPFHLMVLYACDVISISVVILAFLVFASEVLKRLAGKSALPDKLLILMAYLYLAVPLIIFSIGWLKIIFAIFFVAALAFGIWKANQDFEFQAEKTSDSIKFFLISLLIASVWVYFSGIGGYTFQNWDFEARNAVFHDLINHNWPVIYDYRHEPDYRSLFGDTAAMVYYFPFWLPAALVGKSFGWLAANKMLYIWTVLGVALCFYLVAKFTKIPKLWVLVLFIFWSGMDILGQAGMSVLTKDPPYLSVFQLLQGNAIEWWANPVQLFQYSSHTTQLFWVFNQALPTWIVTLLVLNQKKCKSIIFTSALVFLYAPLPAIGLAPFVIYKLFEAIPPELPKTGFSQILVPELSKDVKSDQPKTNRFTLHLNVGRALARIKETATLQNIISGGTLFLTAVLFFSVNIGIHQHGFILEFLPWAISEGKFAYIYILFCLVEFIPFVLLVRDSSNRTLLTITCVVLLVLPLYKYGEYNDFAMRASIPALLILCLLFIQKINLHFLSPDSFEKGVYTAIIIIVILFSSMTPLHEILRSRDMVENSASTFTDNWRTFEKSQDNADKKDMIQNFVTGHTEEKLFFITIGK
jgi:hypothetical protein